MKSETVSPPGRADLVISCLKQFPNAPTQTLAKKLYKEHPQHFVSLEAARSAVRYRRGQNGDMDRGKITDTSLLKEEGPRNPFDAIPDGVSHFDELPMVELDCQKLLRLCDVHIPYHDKTALTAALRWGKAENVDAIIMDDLVDFYGVSFWEKDPDKRDLWNEIKTTRFILEIIRNEFPGARIIIKKGNHDFRWDRFLRVKAPELLSIPDFSYSAILQCDKMNIEVLSERTFCKMASLHIVHGHEFFRNTPFSPVNPARGVAMKSHDNVSCGHWHQTSYHPTKTIGGKDIGAWSVGCLCNLKPDYAPINNWNHGAQIIYRTGVKNFRVNNARIIDGEIY